MKLILNCLLEIWILEKLNFNKTSLQNLHFEQKNINDINTYVIEHALPNEVLSYTDIKGFEKEIKEKNDEFILREENFSNFEKQNRKTEITNIKLKLDIFKSGKTRYSSIQSAL